MALFFLKKQFNIVNSNLFILLFPAQNCITDKFEEKNVCANIIFYLHNY